MKEPLILMVALMIGTVCHAAEAKADFYLSPHGSDAWSGTVSRPNAQGTDGPFASLERARDAVRGLKKRKLTELIRVEGRVDKSGPKDEPVRNLRFRGLTFMHGDRYTLAKDDAGLQHDWDMHDKANALVRLRGTENCSIERCHFAHSGSGALRVDLHGQRNTIAGNHIEHMGGAGILLCGYGPGTKDVNKNNLVSNNHIHHTGRIYSHSPGIMVWQSGENRVANNLVHHTPHHLVAPMIMQCAIRTDGGQMDTLIAENLIYKCVSQGIMLKLNTRVENNIVADIIAPPRGYYLAVREGPLTGAAIKRNVFYSSGKECVFIDELPPGKGRTSEDRRGRKLAMAKDADTDFNIYFCAADRGLGEAMIEKQRRDGVDAHSQAVDPLFVDPESGDFRFKPGSPALKMGIVPIDLSKIGLLTSKEQQKP